MNDIVAKNREQPARAVSEIVAKAPWKRGCAGRRQLSPGPRPRAVGQPPPRSHKRHDKAHGAPGNRVKPPFAMPRQPFVELHNSADLRTRRECRRIRGRPDHLPTPPAPKKSS